MLMRVFGTPVVPPVSLPISTSPKPLKCKKGFQKKKVHGKARCVKVKRHRKSGGS